MTELILGTINLSPYFRDIEIQHGYIHLYLRDVPESMQLELWPYSRWRIPLNFYCDLHPNYIGAVYLMSLAILPLRSDDVCCPIFERARFPHLPDFRIDGVFKSDYDWIPF